MSTRSAKPAEALRAVVDHQINVGRIAQKGQQERQAIWNNTQQEIASMRTAIWRDGQRSADQRAADFSQMIRGVENYQGADGHKKELESGYANAWKLRDGSYVMSSTPGFDIYRDLGVEGERLDTAKR